MNVEIFSAAGGLAEGFRRAGIEFDLVIDRDADACDSYAANLGARPVQMDAHDLLRLVRAGWRPAAAIELFVTDPPCAPWSRAGKRKGLADERDMLAETVELITLLRPRRYLVGNIPGLQDRPHWPVVQRTIGSLAGAGYCVRDFAVLDAADYGVPQRRERPFWFGHLTGPCIRWPAPTHCDPARAGGLAGLGLLPWVTVREALAHLPPEELGRPVRMKLRPPRSDGGMNGGDGTIFSTPDRPAATVVAHSTAKGGQIVGVPARRSSDDRHPTATVDAPARTLKADGGRAGRRESVITLPRNHRANHPDGPSLTMTAKVSCVGPQVLATGHNAIVLSERAAAILQGFPDGWTFCGATKAARWSQLGQAVCPAVAEAIGRAIVEQMRASATEAA